MATGNGSNEELEARLDAELKRRLGPLREQVDAAIEGHTRAWTGPGTLVEAMRYATLSGGKRIRPCLTLAACQAAGGIVDRALDVSVALELIHTYSLVHDDLPAMDDDDERRGKPTVHVAFDEATAILAGDALLTEAFLVVASADGLPADARVASGKALARAAGRNGMVGGQVRDIEIPEPNEEALARMHAEKTGALFCCACELGGISAQATETVVDSLIRYGALVGDAFQVSDDMLDLLEIGRSGGAHEADVNLAAVVGIERAGERVARTVETALQVLQGLPGDTATLEVLARWIGARAQAAMRS